MNGALPSLGELLFLETFQDLAEPRAPHCSVLEGLLEVNHPRPFQVGKQGWTLLGIISKVGNHVKGKERQLKNYS